MPNPALNDEGLRARRPTRPPARPAGGAAARRRSRRPRRPRVAVAPRRLRRDAMTVSGAITATAVLLVLLIGSRRLRLATPSRSTPGRPGRAARVVVRSPCSAASASPSLTDLQARSWPASPPRSTPCATGIGRRRHLARLRGRVRRHRAARPWSAPSPCSAMMLFLLRHPHHQGHRQVPRIVIIAPPGRSCLVYLFDLVLQPVRRRRAVHPRRRARSGILISLAIVGRGRPEPAASTSTSSSGPSPPAPRSRSSGTPPSALLLTLVWLYLEMLRLLGKMQSRSCQRRFVAARGATSTTVRGHGRSRLRRQGCDHHGCGRRPRPQPRPRPGEARRAARRQRPRRRRRRHRRLRHRPPSRSSTRSRPLGGEAVANYDSVATPEGGANIVKTAVDAFGTRRTSSSTTPASCATRRSRT